jgi:hypothetical protein
MIIFMKKAILYFILIFILVTSGGNSFASTLRLMAMGEMQGIVEDDSDYKIDTASIASGQKNRISVDYLFSNFTNKFSQNLTPSSAIYDLQRKGVRDEYQIDAVYQLNPSFTLGLEYSKKIRDYRSSYINQDGDWQRLERNGNEELKSIMVGYKVTEWFDLGLVYDDHVQSDNFDGTEASREGVVAKENSSFRGLACGLRFHSPGFWFSLTAGEDRGSDLTSQTISTTEVYRGTGPGRIGLRLGGRLWDGKILINYGGHQRKFAYNSELKSFLGIQINSYENMILGVGFALKRETSKYLDFDNYSTNLGIEYSLPTNKNMKIRGGVINRYVDVRDFYMGVTRSTFQDYTFGLGYDWGKFKFDFAYKNYQDTPGGVDDWSAVSTPLTKDYVYTMTDQRNSIYVFSAGYEI